MQANAKTEDLNHHHQQRREEPNSIQAWMTRKMHKIELKPSNAWSERKCHLIKRKNVCTKFLMVIKEGEVNVINNEGHHLFSSWSWNNTSGMSSNSGGGISNDTSSMLKKIMFHTFAYDTFVSVRLSLLLPFGACDSVWTRVQLQFICRDYFAKAQFRVQKKKAISWHRAQCNFWIFTKLSKTLGQKSAQSFNSTAHDTKQQLEIVNCSLAFILLPVCRNLRSHMTIQSHFIKDLSKLDGS